jgi:hypothetical protein
MNFAEIIELLRTFSAFHETRSGNRPVLSVYDTQDKDEVYVLFVRANSASRDFLNFLNYVVETRKLGIRWFKEYLVIHSIGRECQTTNIPNNELATNFPIIA